MSSPESWTPGQCNETAGFLFSHTCPEPDAYQCSTCGKPVCRDHAHLREGGVTICSTCARRQLQQERRRGRASQGSVASHTDYDHPYLYGWYYYDGYSHYGPGSWGARARHHYLHDSDPHDFTDADEGSVMYNQDQDYEGDLGES